MLASENTDIAQDCLRQEENHQVDALPKMGSRPLTHHIKATIGTHERRLNLLFHYLVLYGFGNLITPINSILPRRDCIVHWLFLGFLTH